jgi:hypothetical protein
MKICSDIKVIFKVVLPAHKLQSPYSHKKQQLVNGNEILGNEIHMLEEGLSACIIF